MKDLPQRKHPRLKNFDYSQNGYYHITICTQNNLPILSNVRRGLAPADASADVRRGLAPADASADVRRGLAPADASADVRRGLAPANASADVRRGLAPANASADASAGVDLTEIGKIVLGQLLDLENRYSYVKIDKFVIMPTHIHAIVILEAEIAGANPDPISAGASPRPTLMDIVCAFKSLSTRLCNQHANVQGRKIWQTSFYDVVIKNERVYQEIWRYIDENPAKWAEDEYNNAT